MLRVGLTGGIGAGKSTVAELLRRLGATIIDADRLARDAVAPGSEGLAAVVETFGAEVLAADGSLDRSRLAERVFGDAEQLRSLNAIVHPVVAAQTAALVADLPEDAVVVFDIPLLVENDMEGAYDVVVVVDAPDEVRVERLSDRGLTEADIRARMSHQASRTSRLAAADYVVDNAVELDVLEGAVESLWRELVAASA